MIFLFFLALHFSSFVQYIISFIFLNDSIRIETSERSSIEMLFDWYQSKRERRNPIFSAFFCLQITTEIEGRKEGRKVTWFTHVRNENAEKEGTRRIRVRQRLSGFSPGGELRRCVESSRRRKREREERWRRNDRVVGERGEVVARIENPSVRVEANAPTFVSPPLFLFFSTRRERGGERRMGGLSTSF